MQLIGVVFINLPLWSSHALSSLLGSRASCISCIVDIEANVTQNSRLSPIGNDHLHLPTGKLLLSLLLIVIPPEKVALQTNNPTVHESHLKFFPVRFEPIQYILPQLAVVVETIVLYGKYLILKRKFFKFLKDDCDKEVIQDFLYYDHRC
jgi:hypothetical protein